MNYQLINPNCLFDNIAMTLSNIINDNIIKVQALVEDKLQHCSSIFLLWVYHGNIVIFQWELNEIDKTLFDKCSLADILSIV